MKPLLIFAMMILSALHIVVAQDYKQTIKGRVIDKESHVPIGFANIALTNTTFSCGTVSNEDGYYKIENVPVGRIQLTFSFVGYETISIPNLEVTMGKELIVNMEMTESIIKLEEVKVKAYKNKEKPLNAMASVSARTFSVEESQRYAGSSNDVSRMAMNFAGVKGSNDAVNEIVVRGNSPVGVLFRLEGVDIPNPNHFGDGGTTGGPVSMLNNNVLSNSDFLTGAFPAEYGNTMSGVFDLRMRNGNQEKHEFVGQASLNGYEFGAEGPISKKSRASYLINYRYSSLKLFSDLGIELDGIGLAIPDYQDVTFKLNFPSNKIGNISVFGLAGKSSINILDSERDTTEEKMERYFDVDYETDNINSNKSGVIGLSHSYIFGNSAYSRLILSVSTITNGLLQDSLSTIDRTPTLRYASDFTRTKFSAKFYINKKFDSRNTLRTGISAAQHDFTLFDSLYDGSDKIYRTLRDLDGKDYIIQPYAQYKLKINSKLQLTLGLNTLLQTSNGNFTLEPRIGVKWNLKNRSSLSFGYGKHSIVIPAEISHQKIVRGDKITTPNKDLDFMKSHHFVIAYDKMLTSDIRFKAETYYQYISQSVVEKQKSSYSLLNRGSYTFVDVNELKNGGTGYNYGIELTLEKFMDHGMYFLSTLSLYESKYKGSDGIKRNTAFNSNYVYNLLGGKEFNLGGKRSNARFIKRITVDGKFNIAGGQRYSPIDLTESQRINETAYNDSKAYTNQVAPYARIDLRIGFKLIGKKSTQELALDFLNLANRENPLYIKYDPKTGNTKTINQMGFMPNILWRISF